MSIRLPSIFTLALGATLFAACGDGADLTDAADALAPDSMTLKIYGPAAKLVAGAKTVQTATADVDGDGFDDLVKLIDNAGSRGLTIQRGRREGLSSELWADLLPVDARRIAAGHSDRDAAAEVFVFGEQRFSIRRGIEAPEVIDLDY